MSMSDPIADMLTRIRNARSRNTKTVTMSASKLRMAIAGVLRDEGYIDDVTQEGEGANNQMTVALKYYNGKPVISRLVRVSKPGLRVYRSCDKLPKVMGGLGIAIVSTSQGVVSDRKARSLGEGGEVLCLVC